MKHKKMLAGMLLVLLFVVVSMVKVNASQLDENKIHVEDNAGVITNTQSIEEKAKEFEKKTHTNVYIYITSVRDTTLDSIDTEYDSKLRTEDGVLIEIAANDKSVRIRTGSYSKRYITDSYCKRMIEAAKYDFKMNKYDDAVIDILDEGIRKYENKDGTLLQKFMHSWIYGVIVFVGVIVLSIWSWGRKVEGRYRRRLNGDDRFFGGSDNYHHHGGFGGGGGRGGSSGGW